MSATVELNPTTFPMLNALRFPLVHIWNIHAHWQCCAVTVLVPDRFNTFGRPRTLHMLSSNKSCTWIEAAPQSVKIALKPRLLYATFFLYTALRYTNGEPKFQLLSCPVHSAQLLDLRIKARKSCYTQQTESLGYTNLRTKDSVCCAQREPIYSLTSISSCMQLSVSCFFFFFSQPMWAMCESGSRKIFLWTMSWVYGASRSSASITTSRWRSMSDMCRTSSTTTASTILLRIRRSVNARRRRG